jgi:hypothetical protein
MMKISRHWKIRKGLLGVGTLEVLQFTGKAGYQVPFGISMAIVELSKRPYGKSLRVYVTVEKDLPFMYVLCNFHVVGGDRKS